MRQVMAAAEVGDDVYGEDPTVRALEEQAADLLGYERALFVPSGSMANLLAQLCFVPRGQEVIMGQGSHCVRHEGGSGASLAGAQYRVVPGDGRLTKEEVVRHYERRSLHSAGTALVWLENTHNTGGGLPYELSELNAIVDWCRQRDLPVYMDGARLWHAAVALDVPPAVAAGSVDGLSTCLSKALGAPAGSLLYGTQAFIDEARYWRKRLGGGMRQVGILAAAGLHALEHHRQGLIGDHQRAKRLARGLIEVPGLVVNFENVVTNIVLAEPRPGWGTPDEWVAACAPQNVLLAPHDATRIRFVTHRDVDDAGVDRAIEVLAKAMTHACSPKS
jgi:threonine aldolase